MLEEIAGEYKGATGAANRNGQQGYSKIQERLSFYVTKQVPVVESGYVLPPLILVWDAGLQKCLLCGLKYLMNS